MDNQISVTVTGGSRVEIAKNLRAFADNLDGAPADTEGRVGTKTAKSKKASAQTEMLAEIFKDELEAQDADFTEAGDTSDDFETAGDSTDEEDFTDTPSPKKAVKATKLTLKDVNAACKGRAQAGGKKGRDQVLAILKKHFKTETISDLKPEQYAKVISAMQVSQ